VVLLGGCGSTDAPSKGRAGVALEVESTPFAVSLTRAGKRVVGEVAGHRLRYRLHSNDREYALTNVLSRRGDVYRVATNEPGRTATVTVARTATGARIDVSLHPATDVQEIYDAFESHPGDHFLGGGERTKAVDLRGQILSVKVGPCSYAPIPFFASSAGWGLRLDSENEAALAFPGSPGGTGCQSGDESLCTFAALTDRAEVCVQGARLDERLYVGSIPQTLAAYQADTGQPAVPPASELELIKWRDVSNGPADVLDDISRLQSAGIPIGWELVDNPWEQCNGLLTFDTHRFPDPEGLIRQVDARGVKFMLWISPLENCPDGYPSGSLLGTLGVDAILDLRKPAAVAEFQARLRRLVAMGVAGFKGDRGDENDLQLVSPSLNNEYPLLYAKAAIAALPKGGTAIFRAATVGSQSVLPGIWAGDQAQDWTGLQAAIVAGQTAAMSGFPTWGSDIGGYAVPPVAADVFERWAQLGAVSPVFEVGGGSGASTPWTLGDEAMAVLKSSAILHYELFPYFERLLAAHQPVLRPVAYGFPRDPQSWASPFELLVGPDLLAAPVTGQGETPSVYLPPGAWVDLFSGGTVQGGSSFTRPTPMTQFPLYVRLGAVVPFNLRTAAGSWWGVDEQAHPGRAGFLATNGAVLALTGQPAGVQIFVPAASRPTNVTVGGRTVPWSWNAGPLPGVVVRVHGPSVSGRIVVA
jgi:alpha-D-xyloside xylohydrolase